MKKLVLSLALLVASMGSAMAQQQNPGSWKAFDKINKAKTQLDKRTEEGFEAAQALYKEAEDIINADIEEAKTKGKNDKLALLYTQNAELQTKLLDSEWKKASGGIPFDTIKFCTSIDKIITLYNESSKYNQMPDAKGRLKINPIVAQKTRYGIETQMLTMYSACGLFMNQMGRYKESAEYFYKFVQLPKISPVFTAEERDSVIKAHEKDYNGSYVNIANLSYKAKDWASAIKYCNEALTMVNDSVNLHDLYYIKLAALGESKDSVSMQKTLLEAYQRTGQEVFFLQLMQMYMNSGKTNEAVDIANKAVAEDPNNKTSWYVKGYVELYLKKNYQDAREAFEKALAIDPDYANALYLISVAYTDEIVNKVNSGKYVYIGKNRNIVGRGKGAAAEAAYKKQKAIYDKELNEVKSYYKKAQGYLEHLRDIAPNMVNKWAPALQTVYTNLGMKDKAKQMDNELDAYNQSRLAQ